MPKYRLLTWPQNQNAKGFYVETPDGPGVFVQDKDGDHVLLDWPDAQKFQYAEGTYEIYDEDEDYQGTMVPVEML